MNNQLLLIARFFLDPSLTVKRAGKSELGLPLLFGLLYLASLSSVVSQALLDKHYVPVSAMIIGSFASLLLFVIFLGLFLAVIFFFASMPKRKLAGRKIFSFALLSFLPSLLLTPLSIISVALAGTGTVFFLITGLLVIYYELFLLLTTLRNLLNVTASGLILLLVSPLLVLTVFIFSIFIKLLLI